MRLSILSIAVLSASVTAVGATSAQSAPRQLTLVQDGRVGLGKTGGARDAAVVPNTNGRLAVAPRNGWEGSISVYDSAGVALPWKVQTGRNDNAEIMMVTRAGWIAGSNTLWVADRGFSQVALVDGAGKVTKSIEYPSWIHPTWAQRREFPVFGAMEPIAVYADQTMLIMPARERSLIGTPKYDHTVSHLLRMTWTGSIQRTIATLPLSDGYIDMRGKNGTGYTMNIPFAPRTLWGISPDGTHISIATPGVSTADSGTIHLVSLNDRGDTIFAKRYPYPAVRVDKAAAASFLANIRAVGTLSAEKLRDSASKQIPEFQSLLTGLLVGADGATWLEFRAPSDASKETRALIIDGKGELLGTVPMPDGQRTAAATVDHLWTFEPGRLQTPTGILRYAIRPTGAPPARTAKPSTSPTPLRPPR
ncbi:MAG: hypothetical protein ABI442_18570 [Gemmatimonadaceae bacterium]